MIRACEGRQLPSIQICYARLLINCVHCFKDLGKCETILVVICATFSFYRVTECGIYVVLDWSEKQHMQYIFNIEH